MDPRPLRDNHWNRYRAMREFAKAASQVSSSPPSLQIARTNRCNFKCAYCIDHRVGSTVPRSELDGETWADLLRLLPSTSSMAFHGISEFLIDPHFFDVVEKCAAAGVELSINTNGSVCTDKHVAALEHYPAQLYVNFSIDAATEPTYRRIRGWDFARFLRNVETYVSAFERRKAPTKTTLSYVLFASNLHEAADVVHLAKRLGVRGVKFYRLHEYDGLDWSVPTTHGGNFDYQAEHTSRVPEAFDAAVDAAAAAAAATGVQIELPAKYTSKGAT